MPVRAGRLKLGDEDKALGLFERSHAIHAGGRRRSWATRRRLNELADAVEAARAAPDAPPVPAPGHRDRRAGARRVLEQAEPLERLAKDKVEEGAWVEALELSSRAPSATEGGDAKHVAPALDRKATALQALGRAAEAEPLLREALAIHRTQSTALRRRRNLASALREAGRARRSRRCSIMPLT